LGLIKEDSFILVYRDRKRRWIIRPIDTPKLHTHLGILDCSTLIGREFGISVRTTVGDELFILEPTIEDMIMKFSRKTQVIYPKDLGMILFRCGLHSGSKVFEAGTGSGAATAALAHAVMPEGHVFSYDVKEAFQAVARKNLERLGLTKYVTLKLKDPKDGIEERSINAALIDLGDPWTIMKNVRDCLEPSGIIAVVTPTMNQAEKLAEEMKVHSFVNLETVEILLRRIEARMGMTRPSNIMTGHTAYITFGRKTV
jgi:tRNA (adenine57-N1/adenine58-N1)-methyltransferase